MVLVKQAISLKKLLLWFLGWLIITQSFSWLSFNRLRITEPDKRNYNSDTNIPEFQPHPLNFLEMHARQDTAWYFNVAYEGYSYSPQKQSNTSFFPLYPLLMKIVYFLLSPLSPYLILYHRYLLAGLLISLFSLFAAVIVLYKLFRLDYDSNTSFLAIAMLLIFPTSYFLTAIYTESLFLFLTTFAFYLARKNNFLGASTIGFLAALTRPLGVLLLIPLAIELFSKEKEMETKTYIKNSISLLLIPFGLASFMYYLYQQFQNPLLFIDTQSQWGRTVSLFRPFELIQSLLKSINSELLFNHASASSMILELTFLTYGIVVTTFVIIKERSSYAVWAVISLIIPLLTGIVQSEGRFMLVVFPLFLVLARIFQKNIHVLYLYFIASVLLLSFLTVLFVNGYWSF